MTANPPTAARLWPYARRSIERLIAVVFDELDEVGHAWRPDAPGANDVLTLVNHTISNAEDNLLGTIAGLDVAYQRQADFDAPEPAPAIVRARWSGVSTAFEAALPHLDDRRLFEEITHPRRGTITRFDALVVVTRHAAEPLAHAELTRDLYRAHVAMNGGTR